MKYIVFVLLSLFAFDGCGSQSTNKAETDSDTNHSEPIEKQVYEDDFGDSYLVGKVNKSILEEEPYFNWFKESENYKPKEEIISSLEGPLQQYDLELFFGSWCSDSKMHVPAFYKILEETNYDLDQLTAVAVGDQGKWYKKSPDGEHKGKNILHVPTIIFYKNGKEVNRIVETPVETLEEDMLKIATGKEYQHKYEE